jgi:CBS domain-containing protein
MEPLAKLDIPRPGTGLQQRLMEDAVSHLNPAPPITAPADAPVRDAIQLMKQHRVGCVLAVKDDQLAGILSERDLLYKLAGARFISDEIKLQDVMTTRLVTLQMDDSIRFALHQMSVGGFRHIPVVKGGYPVGIISIKDVLRYINRAILQPSENETEASSSAASQVSF